MSLLRPQPSSGLRICLLSASFALIACNGTIPATPTAPTPTNAPAPAPSSGSVRGFAIAIGLNEIDPTHYGTSGALGGSEADASDMEAIPVAEGFRLRTAPRDPCEGTGVRVAGCAPAGEARPAAVARRGGDWDLWSAELPVRSQ